jgi:acetamidase/formamidase
MAGPVFVEGAEKGDLLEVNIEQMLVDQQGFTAIRPNQGPLRDSVRWQELQQPYVHIIKHLPGPSGTTRDGKGIFNDRVKWDLKPFIGTIGVAPEREVETSAVGQGPWGGNLDVRDIKEGTKVLVNCYNDGGLLYVGDVHGSQGDTEFYGTADETRAEVILSCRVIKNKRIPFMRLVKPESIVSLYCYRPLEHAVELTIINLMEWMVQEYGISQREAYMHVCINPDFRINVYQMVRIGRIQYTVGAEMPRHYLE